jgi:hypothetical protein
VLMGRETGSLYLLAPLLLTGGKGADLVIRGNVVLNKKNILFNFDRLITRSAKKVRSKKYQMGPLTSMQRIHRHWAWAWRVGSQKGPYGLVGQRRPEWNSNSGFRDAAATRGIPRFPAQRRCRTRSRSPKQPPGHLCSASTLHSQWAPESSTDMLGPMPLVVLRTRHPSHLTTDRWVWQRVPHSP